VVDGRGWRSGAVVERRSIPQWFLRITDYAEELLTGLDDLREWPEAVKTMQRNWIGRSEGAEFEMQVCNQAGEIKPGAPAVSVFTTRPDTAFGMTYAVLAPEHPLVAEVTPAACREQVQAFVQSVRQTSEADRTSAAGALDKRGVNTGAFLFNPFTRRAVPLFIADYVLLGYGTGAIMAVPGQDQRDWDFAKAHDIPIVSVDSDGDCNELAELLVGAGVNLLWPFERQANNDPREYRKRFPRLGMMGGIDKKALAAGPKAIDEEMEMVSEALKFGGYIPSPDHLIPHDVSFENFRYFCQRLKQVVGK